jgi:hypothetical protein
MGEAVELTSISLIFPLPAEAGLLMPATEDLLQESILPAVELVAV